jgi:hypothetical protein
VRKFEKPFDDYTVSSEPLMSVELHGQGQVRYIPLIGNPIYYFYALQFTQGSLYRAIFGWERLWDRELEADMMQRLQSHLEKLAKQKLYYLEEIEFIHAAMLRGTPWTRGVPRQLDHRKQYPLAIKCGARALARVNLVDKPNHVDIEFKDGTVFSISYTRYLNLKRNHIRSLHDANPKQTGASPKDGPSTKSTKVDSVSRHFAFRTLAPEMYRLRKRFRGLL